MGKKCDRCNQDFKGFGTTCPDCRKSPEKAKVVNDDNVAVDHCIVCKKRVYVTERLSIDDLLMHQTCFRCAQCNSKLTPGAFARDKETGIFFCPTHYKEQYMSRGRYGISISDEPGKKKSASFSDIGRPAIEASAAENRGTVNSFLAKDQKKRAADSVKEDGTEKKLSTGSLPKESVEEKAEEPVAEKAEEPVAEEPVAEKAEEPVAEKVEEPVAEEPVAEKVEEPAVEKTEEPVSEKTDEPQEETTDVPKATEDAEPRESGTTDSVDAEGAEAPEATEEAAAAESGKKKKNRKSKK